MLPSSKPKRKNAKAAVTADVIAATVVIVAAVQVAAIAMTEATVATEAIAVIAASARIAMVKAIQRNATVAMVVAKAVAKAVARARKPVKVNVSNVTQDRRKVQWWRLMPLSVAQRMPQQPQDHRVSREKPVSHANRVRIVVSGANAAHVANVQTVESAQNAHRVMRMQSTRQLLNCR